MAELVIGHTTHESTTIWVRGDKRERWARVTLENGEDGTSVQTDEEKLSSDRDFTWHHTFTGLDADTPYTVVARFTSIKWGLKCARTVNGRLRTFPESDSHEPFSFLHGSCNLSTVRITHTGGLAAAALGLLAGKQSLERSVWRRDGQTSSWIQVPFRFLVGSFYWCCSKLLFSRIYKRTKFEQKIDPKEPLLPSPFKRLLELLSPEKENPPRFMIHAGDQIYYDIPFPGRQPRTADYRRTYRQTWFEDDELRKFLAGFPHYMILDDHDIVDAFATDGPMPGGRKPSEYSEPALEAYREYVHSRQPGAEDDEALFYAFQYGSVPFFVLDTRTERSFDTGQMIGKRQMEALKNWLDDYPTDLKFVVSSVAFLAELRPPEERGGSTAKGDSLAGPLVDDRDDKWCGESFRDQRTEILRHVVEKEIKNLVFLVGDMHCTYHATMRLGRPNQRVAVHELAGGPAYQLQFASRRDFYDQCRGAIRVSTKKKPVPYTTSLRRVHCAASSVLRITASPSDPLCQVRWEVVRTVEDLAPAESPGPGEGIQAPVERTRRPRPLSGRISF